MTRKPPSRILAAVAFALFLVPTAFAQDANSAARAEIH